MIYATQAFNIVITVFMLILTGAAIYGLVRLVRYNDRKYKEEKNVLSSALVTKNQFKSLVDAYINRVGAFGSFAMFIFDIDDFSGLNETYGAERCDTLLKMFADRIIKAFDAECSACRIGGDRIAILYKGEAEYNNIDDIAHEAMEIMREEYPIATEEEIKVTSSIGVALYPICGATYKELMQSLELATYVAKRDGGNRYVVSNSDMKEEETSNLEYFKEVRRAMDNNEFCLYYQPIINMRERKIFGFESFLRWNHPTLGVLTPQKFIHVLEHSGDINFISKWGVEQLFKKIQEIQRETGNDQICMTHNLSTKQLMSETLTDDLRKLIHKYKIDPKRIVLEVIEYAMYEKVEIIKINLLKLRDLGFKISVDGLGLDYSTLSQIEKEPIDILKLDKEFLENIEDNYMKEKFVEMLVESSTRLNRIVIAEGIEESKHVKYVLDNKILIGQGYYFSKPFDESLLMPYITEGSYGKLISASLNEPSVSLNRIKEEPVIETVKQDTEIDTTARSLLDEKEIVQQPENEIDTIEVQQEKVVEDIEESQVVEEPKVKKTTKAGSSTTKKTTKSAGTTAKKTTKSATEEPKKTVKKTTTKKSTSPKQNASVIDEKE